MSQNVSQALASLPEHDRLNISRPLDSLPEYIRFPKRGTREHFSRLSYSTLDRLVRAQECNNFRPPVESRILRARGGKGANRGARLIRLSSLLAYLDRQPMALAGTEVAEGR